MSASGEPLPLLVAAALSSSKRWSCAASWLLMRWWVASS
jgi:hypothetical protein